MTAKNKNYYSSVENLIKFLLDPDTLTHIRNPHPIPTVQCTQNSVQLTKIPIKMRIPT